MTKTNAKTITEGDHFKYSPNGFLWSYWSVNNSIICVWSFVFYKLLLRLFSLTTFFISLLYFLLNYCFFVDFYIIYLFLTICFDREFYFFSFFCLLFLFIFYCFNLLYHFISFSFSFNLFFIAIFIFLKIFANSKLKRKSYWLWFDYRFFFINLHCFCCYCFGCIKHVCFKEVWMLFERENEQQCATYDFRIEFN